MDPNPFAALSLIVAPAILTNASSVLTMSTSNRLARAVDRARDLARQLEAADEAGGPHSPEAAREFERRLDEMSATEQRAVMLLHVLAEFLFGARRFRHGDAGVSARCGDGAARTRRSLVTLLESAAVVAGMIGVGALVRGSAILDSTRRALPCALLPTARQAFGRGPGYNNCA